MFQIQEHVYHCCFFDPQRQESGFDHQEVDMPLVPAPEMAR